VDLPPPQLLVTRTAVATGTAVLVGVLLVLAADLVTWSLAPVLDLTARDLAASLARVAGVLAGGALVAAGLGFLLRSTAGALATTFLLMLVLPLVLPAFGIGWLETVGTHLPGGAALFLLSDDLDGLTRTSAAVVLAGWAAACTAAGAASFLLRDAD
jgi:ABC-2 type transport system permease protein